MNLREARKIMNGKRDSVSLGSLIMAAGKICTSKRATIEDGMLCLKRGNEVGRENYVSECAALLLYKLTKRSRRTYYPFDDFISDYDNWVEYLKEKQNGHGHK